MSPSSERPSAGGMTRRRLLQGAAAAAALPYFVRSSALGAEGAPAANERLSVACIGLGNRMGVLLREILSIGEDVVALCDVDQTCIERARKANGDKLAAARAYSDYRKLFEAEKSLDAVIIGTPDHWHAPLCRMALQAGKHIYCEKPLAHALSETRDLRERWRRSHSVTQVGNQGSASTTFRRCIEVLQAGVLGQVREIHAWHPKHDWPSGVDRPAGEDPVPAGFDWDFWLGTAPVRPYKAGVYHPMHWRGWYDFGGGSLSDFCCHGFNLPVRALKLGYPERMEVAGTGMGKESYPRTCRVTYHFPARGDLNAMPLFWYSGGDLPGVDVLKELTDALGQVPRTGCLFLCEKGTLFTDLWNQGGCLKLPGDKEFVGILNHPACKGVPETLPRSPGHMREWVAAIKGGPKTFSDFDIAGQMTEIGLAGILALRLDREIEWDGEKMEVKGVPEAAAIIRPEPRAKWL